MKTAGWMVLVISAVLAGCASAGPAVAPEELAEAEAAVRGAEDAGAADYAPELLEEARVALAAGRRASTRGGDEGRQRLLEARDYAAAAEARARSERLRRDADRLRREADELEERAEEIRDQTGRPPRP